MTAGYRFTIVPAMEASEAHQLPGGHFTALQLCIRQLEPSEAAPGTECGIAIMALLWVCHGVGLGG
jgi:hypothetical protein